MKNFNLIVSGLGGQGVLTVAAVLGEAAMAAGHDVKVAELHGLAQRFGPLSTHIRFGDDIHSPLVGEGHADLILALERLEALHALPYAGSGTAVLINTRKSVPTVLYLRKIQYPSVSEVVAQVKGFSSRVFTVDGDSKVSGAGLPSVAANTYLMGISASSGLLPIGQRGIEDAMRLMLPEDSLDSNIKAFRLGMKDGVALKKA